MRRLPKLIPDARLAWRFGSVQAAVVLALLSGIQAEALPLLQPIFDPDVWPYISGGLALAIVVLRLLAQPGLEADASTVDLECRGILLSEWQGTDAERLEQARAALHAALDDAAPTPVPDNKQPRGPL